MDLVILAAANQQTGRKVVASLPVLSQPMHPRLALVQRAPASCHVDIAFPPECRWVRCRRSV